MEVSITKYTVGKSPWTACKVSIDDEGIRCIEMVKMDENIISLWTRHERLFSNDPMDILEWYEDQYPGIAKMCREVLEGL